MNVVETVLGPIDVKNLGKTLTHEHLSATIENIFYTPAPKHIPGELLKDTKYGLNNFSLIKQYPYSNRENIKYDDIKTKNAMKEEIKLFKHFGGGSIVENSSHGLNRDLNLMCELSKNSGVNIIAGTGFYVYQSQSSSILSKTEEELAAIIRDDLIKGCLDKTDVKCGVIAEVGSGWPINEFEKRAIRATALLQNETGCGVSFHPGRNSQAPFEIARIYLEAGGNKNKAVLSHLDRTIHDKENLLNFAQESGFFCQFDLFGIESSYYQLNESVDMPSDAQRIDRILWLINEKYHDKILISHDIHTKHRLVEFGGHGLCHILMNVVPQMYNKGLTSDQVKNILEINPAQWLGVSTNYQPKNTTLV